MTGYSREVAEQIRDTPDTANTPRRVILKYCAEHSLTLMVFYFEQLRSG